MSFDLIVSVNEVPPALSALWTQALAEQGFDVEVCPGFDIATHQGFLPIQVRQVPSDLFGGQLAVPVISGFEWSADPTGPDDEYDDDEADDDEAGDREKYALWVMFANSGGAYALDIVLQRLCAALLAAYTPGRYEDPQSGEEYTGEEVWPAVYREVSHDVAGAGPNRLIGPDFPSWAELGVEVG